MNMITTATAPLINIGGRIYSEAQVVAAMACARQLELAYELSNEDNGGGSSIDWDDIFKAREFAAQALSHEDQSAVTAEARFENGCGDVLRHPEFVLLNDTDEPIPLADFEFKRPDDTEGGTPD